MANYKLKVVLTLAITFLFAPALVGASARLHMPPNYLTANTGLVGYWTMDGNKVSWATGSVTDSSGQGNTGTIVGMATSSSVAIGKVGQALNFDGVNDYVGGINVGAAGLSNWTESVWIKTTDTSAGMVLSNRQVSGASSMSLDVGFWAGEATADGFAYYSIDTPNCEWGAVGTTNIANGQWHHILGVRESQSTYKIYVDGVLEGNTNISVGAGCQSGNASSVDPWKIGVGDQWLSSEFNGQIDEVRIYNRALSASEIQALYKSGAAKISRAITRIGDLTQVNTDGANTGSVAVTVPAGATLMVVGLSGYSGSPSYYSGGAVTINGAAMTSVAIDASTAAFQGAMFYRVLPSTGSQTLAWDWVGTEVQTNAALLVYGFYKGIDTISPVRDTYGFQELGGTHATDSLTAQTGDMVIAWSEFFVTGGVEGSITWTNATEILEATFYAPSDGGWAEASPSGNVIITAQATSDDGGIGAIVFKPKVSARINSSQNNQLRNGLVGLWSFNGPDINSTTAFDRSGQGNNGTLTNGPTPAIGKVGQALSFDGVDDYVSAGDINVVDTATALSICVWVKHTTITDDDALVAKRTGSTAGILLYRDDVGVTRNDTYSFFVDDSADADNARVEGAANASIVGVWTHVCGTFQALSSTGLHLYVNGVEDANSPVSASAIGAIDAGTQALTIGDDLNLAPPSNRPFNGRIDEVRIYNRALSAAEIYQLYNMGR